MQQDNDTDTFSSMEPLLNELNNFIQNVDSESIDRNQDIKASRAENILIPEESSSLRFAV